MGTDYSDSRTGNIKLVDLGDGADRVVGFPQGDHIVKLESVCKEVRLEEGNHLFQLKGEVIGVLKSGKGVTTLDLRLFALHQRSICVKLKDGSGHIYEQLLDDCERYPSIYSLSIEAH